MLGIGEFLRAYMHRFVEGSGSELEPIVFGLVLILIMIFMPEGIAKKIGQRRPSKPDAPTPPSSTEVAT